MWKDPIVKKTRELREQYASKFDNDTDAIFEDILRRQTESTRKRVLLPTRQVKFRKNVA